jgi:hypothetical protein
MASKKAPSRRKPQRPLVDWLYLPTLQDPFRVLSFEQAFQLNAKRRLSKKTLSEALDIYEETLVDG